MDRSFPTLGGDAPSPRGSLYDQWRSKQATTALSPMTPVLLTLPSGLQIKAARPTLMTMMRLGQIPDALTPKVSNLIALARDQGQAGVSTAMKAEYQVDPAGFYVTWLRLLDVVWCAAVKEPAFVEGDVPDGVEAIPVSEVDLADKTHLFIWAQGADPAVAEFPDRGNGSVSPVGAASLGG